VCVCVGSQSLNFEIEIVIDFYVNATNRKNSKEYSTHLEEKA